MQPNLETLLNQIPAEQLAQRLFQARNARKLLQQDAAAALSISRPTFINIEKAVRRVSSKELLRLAQLYEVDPYELVASPLDGTDLVVQFRQDLDQQDLGLGQERTALDSAIKRLQDLCIAYYELEQMLGKKHVFNVNTQYPLSGHRDIKAYAASVARQERQRLQLGDEPVPHLPAILEEEYGVRVFRFPMPRGISGFYGYAPGLGGCIGLNEDQPVERQVQTAAHETGHMLTCAQNVQVQVHSGRTRNTPAEQFAGAFGMHFTLPEGGVKKLVYDYVDRNNGQAPSIADLVAMSHQYGVSFQAFLIRLVDLGFLPSGEVKRLTSKNVVRETQRSLGLQGSEQNTPLDLILRRYPERYKRYLVEAYERDLLEPHEITSKYLKGTTQRDIAEVVARYTQVSHLREDGTVVSLKFEVAQERVNWRVP